MCRRPLVKVSDLQLLLVVPGQVGDGATGEALDHQLTQTAVLYVLDYSDEPSSLCICSHGDMVGLKGGKAQPQSLE